MRIYGLTDPTAVNMKDEIHCPLSVKEVLLT
jgi:hypothetical protein